MPKIYNNFICKFFDCIEKKYPCICLEYCWRQPWLQQVCMMVDDDDCDGQRFTHKNSKCTLSVYFAIFFYIIILDDTLFISNALSIRAPAIIIRRCIQHAVHWISWISSKTEYCINEWKMRSMHHVFCSKCFASFCTPVLFLCLTTD